MQPDAGGGGAPDPMVQLAGILARLTTIQERSDQRAADAVAPRVRAINCRSYKIGEDWGNYSVYFRENVRAAYGYPVGDVRLGPAYCSWIGSKLEAGPTLTAYQNLGDAVKNDWTRLDGELARLYVNEEERQSFLTNPGGFKKGEQTLLSYKNELVRLVNLYQPDLVTVDLEYQRQLVDRFIGGLDDVKLQRKLRFHCKRGRMNIQEAYEFAVDYESTEVEEKVKEVAATGQASGFSAVTPVNYAPRFPSAGASATPVSTTMRILERSVDPKVKANEIGIEQLKAANAKISDDMQMLRKDNEEKWAKMNEHIDAKFDRVESLITGRNVLQPSLIRPSYQPQRPFSQPQRPFYQPRFYRAYHPQRAITPGLTGGPGYRNNPNVNPDYQRRPPYTELDQPVPPRSEEVRGHVENAPQTQPQIGAVGAGVPPLPPPPEPLHPAADPQQQAFPDPDIWAEHLEYEPTPMGYEAQGQGTYSYYPQGFH